MTPKDNPKWISESPQGLNPTQRIAGNSGMLRGREMVFSSEEQTN